MEEQETIKKSIFSQMTKKEDVDDGTGKDLVFSKFRELFKVRE